MTCSNLTRNGRGRLAPLFGALGLWVLIVPSAGAQPPASQQQPPAASQQPPRIVVDDDGTVHLPAQAVPMSAYLSPEGKAYMTQHLKYMLDPAAGRQENGIPRYMVPYLERQRVLYRLQDQVILDALPRSRIQERRFDLHRTHVLVVRWRDQASEKRRSTGSAVLEFNM